MNQYNPDIHHRKSIWLIGYDYSQVGLYFITICCEDRICRVGYIEDGKMTLNIYGKIAYGEWTKLPERFPNVELDVFQIMPNHLHGIIVITVGATLAVAQNDIDATFPNIDGNEIIGNISFAMIYLIIGFQNILLTIR